MPKKRKPATPKIRKPDFSHREVDRAQGKELFLAWLATGLAPAAAAEKANVSRTTVYAWKKEDSEFDAKWVDAVETALDKVESAMFMNALAGDTSNQQFIMKHRRRSVYSNVENDRPQQTNLIMNITLQEQFKRLERLGLPLPVIESDYEEVDAPESDRESE